MKTNSEANSRRVAKLERRIVPPVNGDNDFIVVNGANYSDQPALLKAARRRGCGTLVMIPKAGPVTAVWVADVGPAGFVFEGAAASKHATVEQLRAVLTFCNGVTTPLPPEADEQVGGYSWNDGLLAGRR